MYALISSLNTVSSKSMTSSRDNLMFNSATALDSSSNAKTDSGRDQIIFKMKEQTFQFIKAIHITIPGKTFTVLFLRL
jgi:hypothetical protein